MELIPVILYGLLLTFILFYSFVELSLLIRYLFSARKKREKNSVIIRSAMKGEWPMVTIQLPVYNEQYVIGRLIDAVCSIDYPSDKLQIQLLDDSTDESFAIAEQKIKQYSAHLRIDHIRRPDRTGYKAGALAFGLERSQGEFIAIFDADFIPEKDFLRKTLPFFNDENVGVVQTRWGHLNKNYSLLTRLQAFALDAHFSIEQVGRNEGDHFINFNGTAGVWRKKCIEESGGWSWDTLTEDLDLSYRAQLKGWKFKYLEEVASPAELPAEMNSLKAQQYRWSKGAAECARKNLGNVLGSPAVSFSSKIHSLFHLMNSFLFICIFGIGVLSIPVVAIVFYYPEHSGLYSLLVIYYSALVFITLFYLSSEIVNAENKFLAFLSFFIYYPLFLAVSMGLSLYNAIGVMEGYSGKKSAFIRTPKFNITGKSGTWYKSKYAVRKLPFVVLLEGFFFLVFASAIFLAVYFGNYLILPYFAMLTFGFGFVFSTSLIHSSAK
jgi:cellulose synthase/poly-beta-1,6-N-acetylglucosamine synthase-like glycosyltransferase